MKQTTHSLFQHKMAALLMFSAFMLSTYAYAKSCGATNAREGESSTCIIFLTSKVTDGEIGGCGTNIYNQDRLQK